MHLWLLNDYLVVLPGITTGIRKGYLIDCGVSASLGVRDAFDFGV